MGTIEQLMKLAKRRRAGVPTKLPLKDIDGNDLSRVEGVEGEFFIRIHEADLVQQETIFGISRCMKTLDDGTMVAFSRVNDALRYMLDENLLVAFRLPVIDEGGALTAYGKEEHETDVGVICARIKENMDLGQAGAVWKMIAEEYGFAEGDLDKTVSDLGNSPKPPESLEESTD